MQDEPEGVWLTYAELAKVRGIDKASAAKLVLRRRWRRQKDNRGTVRILVPPEWADPSRDPPQDASPDPSSDIPGTINALEAQLATVREALAREQGRAARAEAEADRERDRTEAAQADLARERDRAEGALIRAAASEAEVRALREMLAEARRPWWRRWLGSRAFLYLRGAAVSGNRSVENERLGFTTECHLGVFGPVLAHNMKPDDLLGVLALSNGGCVKTTR